MTKVIEDVKKLYDITLKKQLEHQDFIFSRVFGESEYIGQYNDNSATELFNIAQWASINSKARVLDVGCGTAGVACFYSEKFGWKIDGIDTSSVSIMHAKERIKHKNLEKEVNVENISIYDYVKNEYYDAIYLTGALCHLDPLLFFKHASNFLNKSGTLFFIERVKLKEFTDDQYKSLTVDWNSPGIYSIQEYSNFLSLSGFSVHIKADITGPYRKIISNCISVREKYKNNIVELSSEEDYQNSYRLADAEYQTVKEEKLGNCFIVAKKL